MVALATLLGVSTLSTRMSTSEMLLAQIDNLKQEDSLPRNMSILAIEHTLASRSPVEGVRHDLLLTHVLGEVLMHDKARGDLLGEDSEAGIQRRGQIQRILLASIRDLNPRCAHGFTNLGDASGSEQAGQDGLQFNSSSSSPRGQPPPAPERGRREPRLPSRGGPGGVDRLVAWEGLPRRGAAHVGAAPGRDHPHHLGRIPAAPLQPDHHQPDRAPGRSGERGGPRHRSGAPQPGADPLGFGDRGRCRGARPAEAHGVGTARQAAGPAPCVHPLRRPATAGGEAAADAGRTAQRLGAYFVDRALRHVPPTARACAPSSQVKFFHQADRELATQLLIAATSGAGRGAGTWTIDDEAGLIDLSSWSLAAKVPRGSWSCG